jgi:hypothetical protein
VPLQVSFIIPCSYPVSFSNFNWTPVTVGAALLLVLAAWFVPRCGPSHWYHGKASTLDDASMVSHPASHVPCFLITGFSNFSPLILHRGASLPPTSAGVSNLLVQNLRVALYTGYWHLGAMPLCVICCNLLLVRTARKSTSRHSAHSAAHLAPTSCPPALEATKPRYWIAAEWSFASMHVLECTTAAVYPWTACCSTILRSDQVWWHVHEMTDFCAIFECNLAGRRWAPGFLVGGPRSRFWTQAVTCQN